jgi:DNA-binding NtrC family response regulator
VQNSATVLDSVTIWLKFIRWISRKRNENMSHLDVVPPPSTTQTLLIVDDEGAIVHLCAAILKEAGFSVLPATNSSEALKLIKHHPGPLHLLLTDLVMQPPTLSLASGDNEFPHVHGHDLAIRALRMRKDLRVILMSGNIDRDLAGYGIRRDGLPFLAKPFEPHTLVALVRETLQEPPPSVERLTAGPPGRVLVGEGWFD